MMIAIVLGLTGAFIVVMGLIALSFVPRSAWQVDMTPFVDERNAGFGAITVGVVLLLIAAFLHFR